MNGMGRGFAALVFLAACSGGYTFPAGDAGAGGPFTRDTPPPSRDTPPSSQDSPNAGSGAGCVIVCDQTYACIVTETLNGQSQSAAGTVTFTTVDGQCVTGDNEGTIVRCDGTVLGATDGGVTVLGRAQATGGGGFQVCTTSNQATVCSSCTPSQQTSTPPPPQPGGASIDAG